MSERLTTEHEPEWYRIHRSYAQTHKRVPAEVALALFDERDELRAKLVALAEQLDLFAGAHPDMASDGLEDARVGASAQAKWMARKLRELIGDKS